MGTQIISIKEYANICLNCKKAKCNGGYNCREIKMFRPEIDFKDRYSKIDIMESHKKEIRNG